MKPRAVAHVDEERARAAQAPGKGHGLADALVRRMGLATQPVDHERLDARQVGQLLVGQRLHVGNVGQRPDAVAHDGQPAVHHAEGHHLYPADAERLVKTDAVQADLRYAGIFMRDEAVRNALLQMGGTIVLGINVDVAENAERPQVVQPAHVVVVFVREQNGVEPAKRQGQHLAAEIGAAVDEDAAAVVGFEQGRRALPAVARIGRRADGARAAHLGYARAGAGAKESEFHGLPQIKLTSGCRSMPKLLRTSARMASDRATTSRPVAPPRLTSTSAWRS